MKTRTHIQPPVSIESVIVTVRGEKALLDSDLARIYGVPTFRFNEAVKRNVERFPEDFRFQLTADEWETVRRVRSLNALLDPQADLKSQIAISSRGHGGRRKLPWAFTEHGAIMAANVLNSPQAVRMSVFVVRAFLKMREWLGGTRELARQLKALEAKLTARLDGHEAAIVEVLQRLMRLLDPPPEPEPPRRQIGFRVNPDDDAGRPAKSRKR